MRSSPENFYKLFLGDPNDPNYAQRLNAYNLERMAQAYRAMVIGEMVADGILWVARLPQRLSMTLRMAMLRRRVVRSVDGRFRPPLIRASSAATVPGETPGWRAL